MKQPNEQLDIFTAPAPVAMVSPMEKKLAEIKKHRKFFIHKGETYMKIIPTKKLFNSTTIHEVVTRGDCFAVNINTQVFTVLPASALLSPADE